jgi:hypothetical protein
MKALGAVCMTHAVGEGVEFVAETVRGQSDAGEVWRTLVVASSRSREDTGSCQMLHRCREALD